MDRPRVWVLPVVFALIALSLPAQMVIRDRVAEPYPALFQPRFVGSPERDGVVRFTNVVAKADGLRIRGVDLAPQASDGVNLGILKSTFPRRPGKNHFTPEVKAALRVKLTTTLGREPAEISVTWRRLRYDLDSGQKAVISTIARYTVDLESDGS